jgi:thioredoxin reductase (NADPH)
MFPVLEPAEIERVRRFGKVRSYRAGEALAKVGEMGLGLTIILGGNVEITQHDESGRRTAIVTHGPGAFMGELAQLAGRPALVDAYAKEPVEALTIPPDQLRALLIAEAELGERIMRALILRRVGLLETGAGGPVIVGRAENGDVLRLEGFLRRNGHPRQRLDPETDPEATALIDRFHVDAGQLPIVLCPGGQLLRNPSEAELARCIGLVSPIDPDRLYDVVIVGAGPAGLAAVIGLDALGDADRRPFVLKLSNNERARARAIVIATGARYRRLAVDGLESFEGTSVHYWASPLEAKLCAGQEVALVGAGNSAGQAAVYLASQVSKVWLLVRGTDLSASMSRYLVDRIAGLSNVEVLTQTNVTGLEGRNGMLEAVRWRGRTSGEEVRRRIRHLFLFIGADPNTNWLSGSGIRLDPKGFVLTGTDSTGSRPPLETSRRGIFAIGDVRSGSIKRVAAAVGEGAQVVATLHAALTAIGTEPPGLRPT